MKIKIALPLSLLLTASIFTGCSSGTGNPQPTQQAPQGPISYQGINAKFAVPPQGSNLQSSSSSSCGAVMTKDASSFVTASGFLSLIPDAGPILGAITNGVGSVTALAGSNKANACVVNAFNTIEAQLTTQQNEINNIQNVLALTDNSIWSAINTNANNVFNGNYTTFNQEIQYFNESGDLGFFYQAYEQAGLYDNATGQLTNLTLKQLGGSKSDLTALSIMLNKYVGGPNASSFYDQLTNITGTSYLTGSCTNCYQSVTLNKNTTFINLLQSASSALNTNITYALQTNPNTNLIPMFDDYNNTIVSYYQQSIYALQAAYHILYLANYLNYNQSTLSTVTMPDVLGVPGTYYNTSTTGILGAKATAYNNAQQNLTLFFAALVNQTYQNTIRSIVTNPPIWGQSYPNTQPLPYITESGQTGYGTPINYSALVGSANGIESVNTYLFTALNAYASSSMVSTYSALETNLSALNLVNYQYGGLHNVAACLQSIESYNTLYGTTGTIESAFANPATSCPSILADVNGNWVNQSVFSANTIQPYYESSSANLPILSGAVTNNINPIACNYQQVGNLAPWSMYLYTPKNGNPSLGIQGVSYLMCGNWQTSYLSQNPTPVGNSNLIPGNYGQYGVNLSSDFVAYYMTMLNTVQNNNSATGITFYNPTTITQVDYSGFWSTTFGNTTGVSAGQSLADTTTDGSTNGTNGLVSSWINENLPSPLGTLIHVAALQTTTPDGFIAPYGIAVSTGGSATDLAFSMGVSPNPNVIQAGVTINGQTIYNLNQIYVGGNPQQVNRTPYSDANQSTAIQSMINNYQWTPVTSTLIQNGALNGPSLLSVNGYLLSIIGSQQTGKNNGNVVVCFGSTIGTTTYGEWNGMGIISSYSQICLTP